MQHNRWKPFSLDKLLQERSHPPVNVDHGTPVPSGWCGDRYRPRANPEIRLTTLEGCTRAVSPVRNWAAEIHLGVLR